MEEEEGTVAEGVLAAQSWARPVPGCKRLP